MSNLLEKASIITTPTAYDNGKILSVKPSIVLGEELVTNGDFSNGTNDWSVANGTISVDNDRLKIDGNSGATAEQTVTAIIGKTYKVTYAFTLGTATSGALIITGGNYPTLNAPQGVNTFYTTATQTNLRIRPRLGSNGTMFIDNISVKEAIDADFDFTRNSSATRVNSQGLIEDVQILSSNLVSNGDFSQEGAELITNGDFATDSDWTKDAGWTISNGTASCNGSGVNSLQQSGITTVGKIYKLTFDVLDSNNFNFLVISANFGDTYVDADLNNAVVLGKNTFYIKPTNGTGIRFRVSNGTTLSIDNVSVKEVGQDWTIQSGTVNITDKAEFVGSGIMWQDALNINKSYKVTYEVISIVGSPNFNLYNGSWFSAPSTVGTHTVYMTNNSGVPRFYLRNASSDEITIDNISVVEITDDTNLPRINYEGFSYQDVLGNELIVNGGFSDGLNGWSAHVGSTLELENGMAKVTTVGSQGFIKRTDLSIETGKTYFCKAYITNGLSPQWYINSVNNPINLSLISENTYGGYVTTTGNDSYFYIRGNGTSGEVSYIDNVSVKEVLGQEVVPDSGCGSWLFEPQSTNEFKYSENFTDSNWSKTRIATPTLNEVSPSGSISAYTVLNNATGTCIMFDNEIGSSLLESTFSIFVKYKNLQYISLRIDTPTDVALFDIVNGIIVDFDVAITPKIENYGNGWYRCSITHNSLTAANNAVIMWNDSGILGNNTITSTDVGYILYGAQYEVGSFATSYIPTNGSTVTRLQDAAFGSGSSDLINSTEGVLYAEIAALASSDTNNPLRGISISSGSTNNTIFIYYQAVLNRLSCILISNGATQFSNNTELFNVADYLKIALKYKQNDFALWVNGVEVVTDTIGNAPIGLSELAFDNGVGNHKFYGKVKCVAVFKEALTDEELECLTTI